MQVELVEMSEKSTWYQIRRSFGFHARRIYIYNFIYSPTAQVVKNNNNNNNNNKRNKSKLETNRCQDVR